MIQGAARLASNDDDDEADRVQAATDGMGCSGWKRNRDWSKAGWQWMAIGSREEMVAGRRDLTARSTKGGSSGGQG